MPLLALVIDDLEVVRSALARLLRTLSFEVSEACNGREALALLEAGLRPRVVLVDLQMPEMDGLDFVRSVRRRRAFDEIALIVVTGDPEPARIARALGAGASAHLSKPFRRSDLIAQLDRLGIAHA